MIFSTDKCPICKDKLEMEIVEGSIIQINYFCKINELVRNIADTHTISQTHYTNKCYGNGSVCYMVLPPFALLHHEKSNRTIVRKVDTRRPAQFIVNMPLLDADYGEPYAVVNRLNLLVTFS